MLPLKEYNRQKLRLVLFTYKEDGSLQHREGKSTKRNIMGDCALAYRVTLGLVLLSTAAANLHRFGRISAIVIICCVLVVTGATYLPKVVGI